MAKEVADGRKKGKYLLLHRSGVVARTRTLTAQEPVEGILAVINLETMEQYDGERWGKIPSGHDVLIEAEKEEEEGTGEDEDESGEVLMLGARRCFNPGLVWTYARARR
jgi:hypothetical protein